MKRITKRTIENYRTYLIDEEKSKATIEKYVRDIAAFSKWIGEKQIEKSDVLEYKEYLIEHFAPASVNSVLSSLNAFFEYKELFGLKVKMLKIQKQIFAQRDKELTKAEYEKLLKTAKMKGNKKLFFLMQTICSTGIRVSELKFVTVESVKCGRANINLKGKMRVVILPADLCKALRKYAEEEKIESGSVFVTKNGNPVDRSNIWKMMKGLCEIANVERGKVFPHNLRHLFARTYYSIQKDIVRLADILGHSSVNTTRIYTMETGEIHRLQIEKLGLLRC